MQPNLTRLIRELKKETCPRRVRDEVRGRILARESSPGRLRYAIPMVIAGLILVCCVTVWQYEAREKAQQQARLAERRQVADEATRALGLLGSVLLDASAHSEKIISDRTVPPLRNSLETTKNKINEYINL